MRRGNNFHASFLAQMFVVTSAQVPSFLQNHKTCFGSTSHWKPRCMLPETFAWMVVLHGCFNFQMCMQSLPKLDHKWPGNRDLSLCCGFPIGLGELGPREGALYIYIYCMNQNYPYIPGMFFSIKVFCEEKIVFLVR